MAEKIILERVYIVPLRKGYMKAPMYKRAKRAVNTLKIFLLKHMKGTVIKLEKELNEKIWERGMKNPPHKIKVVAKKDDKGIVTAQLAELPKKRVKEEKKKDKKQESAKEKKTETQEPAEKPVEEPAEKQKPEDAAADELESKPVEKKPAKKPVERKAPKDSVKKEE
ncbi:60S ribosomal protein L31 [Candidatus Woesearchaeota archaeon]|nr:60S ribosomal protein L31 [Candidatus Woesearchaeota archaeon]